MLPGKSTMRFYDEFGSLIDALNQRGIDYAVCGGVAVAFHGYPRFTKDIDILIRSVDLDRALQVAKDLGFILPSGRIPFDVGKPTEREIYRISKAEGEELLTLDLLVVAPVFESAWKDRERFEWQKREVGMVSHEGLIKMKEIAGRPQDLVDIERLRAGDREGDAEDE